MEEKKRTLEAVVTTSATQSDIFISKGLMGIFVSMIMGILILILNNALSVHISLIIVILFLGAIMAASLGLILGAFMKDTASLYSTQKGFVMILYGTGLIALFPQIPKWIGKLFPSCYVINPIMEITQKGGNWSTVYRDVSVLIGIIIVLFAIVEIIANKTSQQEV